MDTGDEEEGSTAACQPWALDSVCQRGSCIQPASCYDDTPAKASGAGVVAPLAALIAVVAMQ